MPVTIQPATIKYKNDQGQYQSVDALKGDSGVYYGTTEPVDPSVNVWINPDGENTGDISLSVVNGKLCITYEEVSP